MSDASFPLARWRLGLAEFVYQVTYRLDLKQQATVALSRILTDGTDQTPLDNETSQIWEGAQNDDNDPEEREPLVEVTIGQGKNKEPEVRICTIDREDPPFKFHIAGTKKGDLTPITFEELLRAQWKDD